MRPSSSQSLRRLEVQNSHRASRIRPSPASTRMSSGSTPPLEAELPALDCPVGCGSGTIVDSDAPVATVVGGGLGCGVGAALGARVGADVGGTVGSTVEIAVGVTTGTC